MEWLSLNNGQESLLHEDFLTDAFGFVYMITNLETGKFYIGKKALTHNKKKKLTKKELAQFTGQGRKPVFRIDQVDSGWRDYYGSSKELVEDVKKYGKDKFKRVILAFLPDKKTLTFSELRFQILYDVLFKNTYNDNILGKFYRRDFVSQK